MKSTFFPLLACALAMGSACSSDEDPTGPDQTTIAGLGLTAEVIEVQGGGTGGSVKLLSLRVTLANQSGAPIDLSYPAACPVRIRLYSSGTDALLYDQTTFPCELTTVTQVRIETGGTKTFSTPSHFPWDIDADSIPPAFYRAVAVLRVTGQNPIEVEAGQYRLPTCVTSPTPNCVYGAPGVARVQKPD